MQSPNPAIDKILHEGKGIEHFPRLAGLTWEKTFVMPYAEFDALDLTAAETNALHLDYFARHNLSTKDMKDFCCGIGFGK